MVRHERLTEADWIALFSVGAMTELERAFAEPVSSRVGQLTYRTRTIRSGPVVECEVYPIFTRRQEKAARKARENLSTERQQRANHAAALRRVIRLANCNFGAEDLHVTLTYQGRPPEWEQAQKDVRNFLRRLNRIREKRGLGKAKYIYAIEDNESGLKKRIHTHMLLSGGLTREEIEACWRKGWANADRLQPDEEGLAAIARYITKAQRNRKRWVCSHGLKQPEITVSATKLSNRRVRMLTSELPAVWKEVLRKVYPALEPVRCETWTSDLCPGVFVHALLRRVEARGRRNAGCD
ncbi:MAG: hypothetical protein IKS31_04960 [Clostridia bacterium]|nr:hypothetical protein [Clostridia bacterium]